MYLAMVKAAAPDPKFYQSREIHLHGGPQDGLIDKRKLPVCEMGVIGYPKMFDGCLGIDYYMVVDRLGPEIFKAVWLSHPPPGSPIVGQC